MAASLPSGDASYRLVPTWQLHFRKLSASLCNFRLWLSLLNSQFTSASRKNRCILVFQKTRTSLILRLKNAEDVAGWNDFVAISTRHRRDQVLPIEHLVSPN